MLALPQSARADEPAARFTDAFLASDSAAPAEEELASPGTGLPLRLEDEIELRDAHMISFTDFLPQGRLSQKTPFFDFSKFEMGGCAGVVDYSVKFKSTAHGVAGITARVPVPGLPLGEWGIWGEVLAGYVSRDLPFYYNNKSGIWYGVEVGADYTFVREPLWFLRGQAGILYAYWNNVNSLDNGIGLLLGAQFGWYWIKGNDKATMNLTPQLSFDGKSWIAFLTIGFSVDF